MELQCFKALRKINVDVQVITKMGTNHRIVLDHEMRPSLSNCHHTSKHGEPSLPVKEMQ